MKAEVQNTESKISCCVVIKSSCRHQGVHQLLMAGLHVKCGGVVFPFVCQIWSIGAGWWLTCVQWPVCSSGLRKKIKIETHRKTESWKGNKTNGVLPKWCPYFLCSLGKKECLEELVWVSHTASLWENVYRLFVGTDAACDVFWMSKSVFVIFPGRATYIWYLYFWNAIFSLTWQCSISSICCSAGSVFSQICLICLGCCLYITIMQMAIKRTRHQKSSRFNVKIICLFSWSTGTLGPRDHLISVHNNSAFQIIALKFSIYICHLEPFQNK